MDHTVERTRLAHPGFGLRGLLGFCLLLLWAAPATRAIEFGRLTGIVTDPQGGPLMGATVFVVGPAPTAFMRVETLTERVITDAHGRFTVEHLAPGRYSLRVIMPARLPAVREVVRVEAGQTTAEKLVLTDVFTSLRFKAPSASVTNWGDNWKWVLRASAASRPILRFQDSASPATNQAQAFKPPLPASRRLIGVMPGSSLRDALAEDRGLGSVLAYLRPLSDDSDLLVAGSMSASGLQGTSVATSFRRHIVRGDPQELSLVVHQLSFLGGGAVSQQDGLRGLNQAQGIVVNYVRTQRLSDALTFSGGMEIDYLNAARDASVARPRMKLEYRANRSTAFTVAYGAFGLDDSAGTLLERIGDLNAFPRVTLRNNRPRLEELRHAELSFRHHRGRSRLEVAAYRDYFENATVAGLGGSEAPAWLGGYVLPNPNGEGVTVNAGNYRSRGLRAAYSLRMGHCMEASVIYTNGEALRADLAQLAGEDITQYRRAIFRPWRSQSIGGKLSAFVPASKTQFVTSYQMVQRDRVTVVDPFGLANLELTPFLGVQIRQPLPTLALIPAHIDALADFRNLFGQGYVPVSRSGGRPFYLTSSYRSIRGGFSVQF